MRRLGEHEGVLRELRARLDERERRMVRRLVRPRSLWHWWPLALLVGGGLTLVQVSAAALDHWTAPRIAESCVEHRDCGRGELCLKHLPVEQRYCTHACTDDSACPETMRCGDLSTIPEADRGVGAAGPASANSACIR